jgi:hypothetical protein
MFCASTRPEHSPVVRRELVARLGDKLGGRMQYVEGLDEEFAELRRSPTASPACC